MSPADPALRTHRLGNGRAVGWFVVVAATALAVQALWTGEGTSRWASVTACVAAACGSYLLGLRPGVTELPLWLEVRNPVRTVRVYWSSITKVDADDVVRVHVGDEIVRCFALPRRDRRPVISGFASTFGGRTLPDDQPVRSGTTTFDVVERIEDRAHELRGGNAPDGPPEIEIERAPLVALIVGGVNVVACVLLVVLG